MTLGRGAGALGGHPPGRPSRFVPRGVAGRDRRGLPGPTVPAVTGAAQARAARRPVPGHRAIGATAPARRRSCSTDSSATRPRSTRSSTTSKPAACPTTSLRCSICSVCRSLPGCGTSPTGGSSCFGGAGRWSELSPIMGRPVNEVAVRECWSDVLRLAAGIKTLALKPSAMLRKLGAYRQQNRLHLALGEIGRIERSLFMLDWIEDPQLRKDCNATASAPGSAVEPQRGRPCPGRAPLRPVRG